YVNLILRGGKGSFLGRPISILGLERAQKVLARMPQTADVRTLDDFIHGALQATAHPIEIDRSRDRGRTWVLSANVQAYALALTITFLTLMLAAGSLA